MGIEIRHLTVDDVFTVARMLSKVTKGARAELALALAAKKEAEPMPQEEFDKLSPKEQRAETKRQAEAQPNPTELGLSLMQCLFIEAETDLKEWLASLVGKTVDEFNGMPATTIIDIVDAILKEEGIADFFGRVSQLVTKAESAL